MQSPHSTAPAAVVKIRIIVSDSLSLTMNDGEIYFNLEHLDAVDLQTSTNPKWVQNRLGNWRDEKNPARNDLRGDLVLMQGTDAKKLV